MTPKPTLRTADSGPLSVCPSLRDCLPPNSMSLWGRQLTRSLSPGHLGAQAAGTGGRLGSCAGSPRAAAGAGPLTCGPGTPAAGGSKGCIRSEPQHSRQGGSPRRGPPTSAPRPPHHHSDAISITTTLSRPEKDGKLRQRVSTRQPELLLLLGTVGGPRTRSSLPNL